nr:polymorphic toxin-type HINT domain-containing protein [Saccharothrix sp. ST-888]
MADGTSKPIEQLTTNDKVAVTDPQTGVTAPEQVIGTITTPGDHEFTDLKISAANGSAAPLASDNANPSTVDLVSTQHHPYWDVTTHRWTDAAKLQAGDQLRTANGTLVTVVSIRNYQTGPQTAHDLTIDNLHTYYVLAGTTPVLVHNCPIPGEATVHLDRPAGHALITIKSGDEVLSTHQFGGVDLPTNGVSTFDPAKLSPTTINVRIPLPNPEGAMAFAEVQMAKAARGVYPRYDLDNQSCVTYCAQVLRAGGVSDIPLETMSGIKWLLQAHG